MTLKESTFYFLNINQVALTKYSTNDKNVS